jgi:hypothetical protein
MLAALLSSYSCDTFNLRTLTILFFFITVGTEEWLPWWLNSMPPGHGTDSQPTERGNRTAHLLSDKKHSVTHFIEVTVPSFLTTYNNHERFSGPVIRDVPDQVAAILSQSLNRQEVVQASILMQHPGNMIVLTLACGTILRLFNSSRNLAQHGFGNILTPKIAVDCYERVYLGQHEPVGGYQTVEEARVVLSR